MHIPAKKKQETKSDTVASVAQQQSSGNNGLKLTDNRAKTVAQRKLLQTMTDGLGTKQLKTIPVNDDKGLEAEADAMGAKAAQRALIANHSLDNSIGEAINKPVHTIQKTAQAVAVAQLIPDKEALYFRRLRQKAEPTWVGGTLAQHLVNYITNAANVTIVGANVANAVVAAFPGGAVPAGLVPVQAAVNIGLAANLTVPGQYAADTAWNADLTGVLRLNPFIQSVMNGTVHNQVSNVHGTAPPAAPVAQAGGFVPPVNSIAPPGAGADDRVLETTDLFNRLTNLTQALPAVNVNAIGGPHAAMGNNGDMDLGWAAARGNILHEFGHHLENNFSPADFATLHNFLTARTRAPAPGVAGPMAGMRPHAGYIFENHPGYNIDMPKINAGGVAARPAPQTWWQNVKHGAAWVKQGIGRAYHATPLRYLGLVGSAVRQKIGKVLSNYTHDRRYRNWGNKGVENFFVHNANNQQMSYSTVVHHFNTPHDRGTTEYLSTTVEFFNRPSHARELVSVDPMRAALFLYLGNRPQYNQVRIAFAALPAPAAPAAGPAPVRPALDDLIHAVR